jgi:hypothetical protein
MCGDIHIDREIPKGCVSGLEIDGAVNEHYLTTFDAFIAGCRAFIDVLALERSRLNWRISEEALVGSSSGVLSPRSCST